MSRISVIVLHLLLCAFGLPQGSARIALELSCPAVSPLVASQVTTCAVVFPTKVSRNVSRNVLDEQGRVTKQAFSVVEATVEISNKLPVGSVIHVVLPQTTGGPIFNAEKLLILGWRSKDRYLNIRSLSHFEKVTRKLTERLDDSADEVFGWAVFPWESGKQLPHGDSVSTTYKVLVECLAQSDDNAVRIASTSLALTPENDVAKLSVSGLPSVEWIRTTLVRELRKIKADKPVHKLRVGGLIANWQRGSELLQFVQKLPALIRNVKSERELEGLPGMPGKRATWDARADDVRFLGVLDLVSGIDPDIVIDLALANEEVRWLALDPRVGKPSIDRQRKLMAFFDSPIQQERAMAFNHFARWYHEGDKRTSVRWSRELNATVVFRESELSAYWRDKVVGKPPPLHLTTGPITRCGVPVSQGQVTRMATEGTSDSS